MKTPTSTSGQLRSIVLALAGLLMIGFLANAAWQGSLRAQANIPITGERADGNQTTDDLTPASNAAKGEIPFYNMFARPETWGLLAAIAGTLILGLTLTVLSRHKQ